MDMLYATYYSTVGCYWETPFSSLALNTICHLYKTSRPDRIHVTLLLLHRTTQVDNALKLTYNIAAFVKTLLSSNSNKPIQYFCLKKFSKFTETNPNLNDHNGHINAKVISLQEYCYFYITKNKYVSLFSLESQF